MARRRYQRGHLRLRGKREKVWVAMWREDVIAPDGTTRRIRKSEVLGTLEGVQNTAARRTRPGTAALGRQLTHLQTPSHSYVLGVREIL
jgi:hypothetical protein